MKNSQSTVTTPFTFGYIFVTEGEMLDKESLNIRLKAEELSFCKDNICIGRLLQNEGGVSVMVLLGIPNQAVQNASAEAFSNVDPEWLHK